MEVRPQTGEQGRFQATVMFADITGFTAISAQLGAEQAYGHVTAAVKLLDEVVRRHGGSVDKYLGDALMAVFGYPLPHATPESSAIRAALEMQSRVDAYRREADLEDQIALCIGINTGTMIAGAADGPVVREFHILGDAVNTAARLKSKAPVGQVYVGSETCERAREQFEFEALEPMALKGKSRPVPVHRVVASRRGASDLRADAGAGEFIDRIEELARLRAHAMKLTAGTGGVVGVRGGEGIGKSRLLAALVSSPECASLRWVDSRPESLVRDLAELPSEQPALILLDELHWADSASIARLPQQLAELVGRPILVVLAVRSDDESSAQLIRSLSEGEAGAAEVIEVGPLGETDARRLLESLEVNRELSEAARTLVLERGAGNPQRLIMGSFLAGALGSESAREQSGEERSQEAERRYSTILFADLTGFTALSERLPPEEAYPIVAECMRLLHEIARKHGGTVDKHLGDCVLGLFGIPRAIEDAPRAAVNAAIEMVRAVRRFSDDRGFDPPLDAHIGINTGLGIAGDVSGPLLKEFAVMGDSVVIASELTDHATRGQIFVGAETHRFTRDVFEYESSEPLEIRGFSEPIETFELISRVPRLHRARIQDRRRVHAPLVGRDPEMDQLAGAVESARAGAGRIVSLLAEAGEGKSRLVAELRDREKDRGLGWREGRAISTGQQQSYHPFADLCRSWAGVDDEDDEETTRSKLRAIVEEAVGDDADEIYPFIGAITSARLEPSEQEQLDRIQGESKERLIRAAITTLLRRSSERGPVVVVLDDLHWADQSSIELLESLLKLVEDHAILFLHVFRPRYAETSDRILDLVRGRHGERHLELELGPLDRFAARELIKRLFQGGDVPHETRMMIEDKTKGNPFYIEEVVRTLADLGAVEYRDGSYYATDRLASVEIPGSVQEAVMARVDRLGLERKSVLQAASVVGGSFHLEVLEEMVVEVAKLPAILDSLEEGEFIVPTDRSAGVEFSFKHPLIQEVTYDAILEARRETLHLQVAQATERRLTENVPGFCAMLAYHFSMGRDAEHAEEYLFRAGDQAARMAASSEALHFFREASALYLEIHGEGGDPAKKALLEKNVAQALLNRGQLIEAVDHFDRATGLLGAPASRRPAAMLAGFAWNLVRVLAGLYLPKSKRRRRDARAEEVELFDVMFRRAMAQSTSAPTRFFVDCTALLRRLSAVDPLTVPESAAMYTGVVGIFAFGGISFDVSRRFLDIAHELADSGAVDERVLYYWTLTHMHHMLEGDWSVEHEATQELIDEGVRQGRFWEVSTCVNLRGVRRIYQGDFAGAREAIEQLAKIAELYEHDLAASGQHALTAYLHVERREFPEALRAIELYHDEHREALFNLQAFGTRAKVETLMGEPEQAALTLERADALLKEAGRAPPWHASVFHSARYLADVEALEVAVAAGEGSRSPAAKRAALSRKGAMATARKVAWRRPEVWRLAGREDWLNGRRARALESWERGLCCCESLGARPELGRTWLAVGQALAADGSTAEFRGCDASACIANAREIFRELDLAWDLERVSAP